ncbi:MAG: hypothetical protein NTY35_15700 [Planctomycetota bacterium]|nr:hypothetical protein [Planctomycetota bacterium]
MASPSAVRAQALVLGVLGSSVLLAGPAAAQDPFLPGVRWTQGSDAAAPAIPRSVVFGAEENVAWTAWSGTNPAFSASAAHAAGPNAALSREPAGPGSSGSIGVAGGSGPWLVALDQVAAPDAWHRRTVVRGSWIDDVVPPGGLAPRWTREFPFAGNGAARIAGSASGAHAWVAAFDDTSQRVRVERLDSATGSVTFARELDALGLQEIAVASDGSRAVLAAGLDLWVLDAQGSTLHHAVLTATTTALAIAGDGRTIAHGAPGNLRLLREGPTGFALAISTNANVGELAVRAALDGNGSTLAIGWWSANSGTAWRFEVRDTALDTRLEQRAFVGPVGGLQDLPTAIALTADGRRAAFACWGDGTNAPEVGIWDRASDTYVLEANLPGSAFGLALDSTGTRALVAAKSTHANVLAATGEVRLFDTGERELQVLGPPLVGGSLHLAARAPGATAVLFLQGDPAPVPFRVPGIAGQMRLLRVGLGVARLNADGQGRADWTSAIPADPAQIGTTRSFQAAFRSPGGTRFGATLLLVRIL